MAEAIAAPDSRVESSVLPEAFAVLDREGWSVLDLGPASPATVAFYSRNGGRVGFADAQRSLVAMARQWPIEPALAQQEFRRLIPASPERPWRLVLLWDLLDYLPGDMLEQLTQRLAAVLAPAARLHGFVTVGPQTVPGSPPVYQILGRDSLYRWIDAEAGRESPPRYSPWHLQRYISGARQESSRQRRDARQEHLLVFGR